MSDHTEADHPDRLGAAFNQVHLTILRQSSLVSMLQVGLWRHTGAWRGREGAPYSTLVPSDGKLSQQLFPLPISVNELFIYFMRVCEITLVAWFYIYLSEIEVLYYFLKI